MEDSDNISEEYKLLARQVYNDYIAFGNLEETAKKHKIPVSLAKSMIEDATGTSTPSPEERKLSIPIEQLKEEYMKCLSLRVLAERYGVGIKAVSWAFRKHGISIIKLHHEVTLKKIRDEYAELVQKLGRHPTRKEITKLNGGKHLYFRIYFQYGSLSNFRKTLQSEC
ncbi:MAG: hypothetical protein KKD29_03415 [Candidatus Omnitrophica bacterium]|nr:hypothetical protein [Candidatus Omnitrophota bacterium]MBU4487745.1 hypothetical protein [Candidatus Omnitrophota bacterium]MCG2705285.1 hypothetical protein [Candidatus Omnitrophota bacterium]